MRIRQMRVLQAASLPLALTMLSSCGGLNTMLKKAPEVTYKATPNPLEMHADSILLNLTGQYPPKYFNKKAVMTVTPVLKYEGGETAFKSEILQGEVAEANGKPIAFEAGGQFNYKSKIAYAPGMEKAEVVLRIKAKIKDKEIALPDVPKVAEGTIVTPLLLQAKGQTIEAMDQFKPRESFTKDARLLFKMSQAAVQPKEIKKSEIKELQKFMMDLKKTPGSELTGMEIASYASPDGSLNTNEKLANMRFESTKKFVKKDSKKKVKEAELDAFFKSMVTAEDWDGLKKLVEASSVKDKEMILRILSMNSDPVAREKELRGLARAFVQLAKEVLPELRRSEMRVQYDKVGKSNEQLLTIGKNAAATEPMNIEEFLKAATLAATPGEKAAILKNATVRCPEEWRAFNNLGCAYLAQGNVAEAQAAFNQAEKLSSGNQAVKNNLGVIAYQQGNTSLAVKYFEEATGAGTQVNYNKGNIQVKKGNYADASKLYGSSSTFNAALARLLNNENEAAIAILNRVEDKNDPMVPYLKAVAGARMSKDEVVMGSLRDAVSKDRSLAAKAKTDAEFLKYFSNDTFKAIVQ